MKIGIISDTHGDARSWQKVMAGPFKDARLLIHAGDILYHGPRNPVIAGYDPPALAALINGCPVPVLFARGNCDAAVDQLVLEYPVQAPYVFLQIGNFRIMAHHGDGLDRAEILRLARRYQADLFISGHTHVPLLEQEGEVVLLNPGSPSLPKGDGRASVALLECGEGFFDVKVIYFEDGAVLELC
ncbi:MAG: phosphodiesterase [Firmicutes bacterium]|nr:phosphodiesterase [Bacillota bacterium]